MNQRTRRRIPRVRQSQAQGRVRGGGRWNGQFHARPTGRSAFRGNLDGPVNKHLDAGPRSALRASVDGYLIERFDGRLDEEIVHELVITLRHRSRGDHDARPIGGGSVRRRAGNADVFGNGPWTERPVGDARRRPENKIVVKRLDRKSTRLNSSH